MTKRMKNIKQINKWIDEKEQICHSTWNFIKFSSGVGGLVLTLRALTGLLGIAGFALYSMFWITTALALERRLERRRRPTGKGRRTGRNEFEYIIRKD